MAEATMWDKFKSAMTEGMPEPKKDAPLPGVNQKKANDFSNVFNSDSGAISRRLEDLKRSK